ncbi:MAG: DUF2975 domain-containing protein [Bacilli bacterium]|nr:DUF2975 domain-containing protein [Bacilli bacterium]
MEKSIISKFLLILMKIMFIVGIICSIFLPYLYDLFVVEEVPNFGEQTILYQIAFYTCYIAALLIIFLMIRIFDLVYSGNPFIKKVVLEFKKIAVLFMFLAVVIAIKNIFIPTILSASVALITFIISLSFYVLSKVFEVAISYKQEIDYTV